MSALYGKVYGDFRINDLAGISFTYYLNPTPCMTCGWSGIVQCRKCLASGIVKCPRSDCKDGWIVSRPQYEGRRSRRPPDVKLCPECRGVGRISCPECKGMRANLCKRCFGTGCKR